jgi:predicted nucleotidyltransferase
MRVLAIIAEYDPFHNGHLYHLEESLLRTGADASVVFMSGCFTQRGLPAMTGKRLRARAAACCGVDLVVELPFVYAAGGAEMFARGAVRIMEGLGVVDFLSFGSESGDKDALAGVAALFAENPAELNGAIREEMGKGVSYPAARERAAARLLGSGAAALMRAPNNILAIEYLRELIAVGSGIQPVTIRRASAGVGETNEAAGVAGATALRTMFEADRREGDPFAYVPDAAGARVGLPAGGHPASSLDDPYRYMPDAAVCVIREHIEAGGRFVFADALFPHLVKSVITADASALSGMLSATEGLENRLATAVRRARCMDEAVRYTKTRRYTETRVRRLILHTVMGLTKDAMAAALTEPPYARVLAFSETGARLIRRAKKEGSIPVITNAHRERGALAPSPVTFGYDLRAAELYRLLECGNLAGFNEKNARPYRHT